MKTVTIEEAQADFRRLVADRATEPVEIVADGERIGVFLPGADADLIEDLLLAQRAADARVQGYIGLAASSALMRKFRDVEG